VIFYQISYNLKLLLAATIVILRLFISNLIFFWLVIFISLVMFIKNEERVKDSIIKFIFVQEILRALLILFFISSLYSESILFILLIIKIGIPPFHSWVILLIKRISWLECIIFLTLLKVVPIYIVYNIRFNLNIVLVLSVVSTFLLFSSSNVKEILFFSRRRNRLLIVLVSYFSYSKAIYFFLFYSLLLVWVIWDIERKRSIDISSCLLLVFIGVPPLIIFIVKYLLFAVYSNRVVFFLPFLILLVLNLYCYFFFDY